MRFHWFKDLATKKIETLRFMRALLGLSTSTFLHHMYPKEVEEIRRSLHVDDFIGGETTVADERDLKQALQSIFRAGKFELHK